MNYYLDTEFYERGPDHPIQLISIGLVGEDGREFYVENSDVDVASLSPWLKENVVPYMQFPLPILHAKEIDPNDKWWYAMPHKRIGEAVLKFLYRDVKPKFWAYFADYDWVVFCQLFGSMTTLPEWFPHFCLDLKQEMVRTGTSTPVIDIGGPKHNALNDARWNKALHEHLKKKGSL